MERKMLNKGISCIAQFLMNLASFDKKGIFGGKVHSQYIFRGINEFYFTNRKGEEDNGAKKDILTSVEDDKIRSGLSIRLEKKFQFENNSQIHPSNNRVNYINELELMLADVRKNYPNKYTKDMSDLDVLADIQHNGGATCLVDFSQNVLTSLYFACCDKYDKDGFVYCYDIINDMIMKDMLTYLKPNDEKRSIRSLLLQTYKETNISSDETTRFCLWKPSSTNNRIARQDSIFLFGIEPFIVKEHAVKVIKIDREDKLYILFALKNIFNISGETIYNDHVGFASSNNKYTPLLYGINPFEYYEKGFLNMIYGNYDSALNYLNLWKVDSETKHLISKEDLMEYHFSLAVCYKNSSYNSGSETIHYKENAICEYKDVVSLSLDILKERRYDNYYRTKCVRAFNGIMDLLFETKRYKEAIMVCDEIIETTQYDFFKVGSNEKNIKDLNPKYCRIEKMEILYLDFLSELQKGQKNIVTDNKDDERKKEYVRWMDDFFNEAHKSTKERTFDRVLIRFYKCIFDILISDKYDNIDDRLIFEKLRNSKILYTDYIPWNFMDIKIATEALNVPSNLAKKRSLILNIIARMISIRDEYEMRILGNNNSI